VSIKLSNPNIADLSKQKQPFPKGFIDVLKAMHTLFLKFDTKAVKDITKKDDKTIFTNSAMFFKGIALNQTMDKFKKELD
jgi:hypothetical protein